jgi:spermidine synthase
MLLAGYFYADRLAKIRNLRTQMIVHLVLMAVAVLFLPVRFTAAALGELANENPVLSEFMGLLRSVGIPYFMVSTTAPLMQSWFSRTKDAASRDPYFLYAASNMGSLLALIAYPLLIEPTFGVRAQSLYWLVGYVVLILLAISLNAIFSRAPQRAREEETALVLPPSSKTRLFWLAAAFVPSGLMLAVTTHISVNLTPMPLVWTLPLAVYLSTFIFAFARRFRISTRRIAQVSLPLLVLLCPVVGIQRPVVLRVDVGLITVHLVLLFIGGLLCHTALAESRPDPRHLTQYYVWMALGGVLGGIFAAIVAPMLFHSIFEYPLLLAAAVFFRQGLGRRRWLVATVLASLVLAYGLYLPPALAEKGDVVYITRNFFGVKKVVDNPDTRELLHGDTLHGLESRDPLMKGEPMIYYHREGPLGDVMTVTEDRPDHRVAVVGLGAGSIAAYAGPNRHVTFFEIDPDVEVIASRYFTFLTKCGSNCDVVSGDGRLSIGKASNQSFDLIILDAFSSDSIPPHLLSKEALDLYRSKLKPGGAVLFHVSNRYLKVNELVAALASSANTPALIRDDKVVSSKSHSVYVIVSESEELLRKLQASRPWKPIEAPQIRAWTDDYSNLIELLKW